MPGFSNGIFIPTPFDLLAQHHDSSPDENDPFTDWFYFYSPTDTSPGQDGYDEWLTEAIANGNSGHSFFDNENPIGRIVFFNHDAGDISDGTLDAIPEDERMPEVGTIFRIETRTPPAPILSSPGPNQILAAGPVDFRWWTLPDFPASLLISTTEDFTNVVWTDVGVTNGESTSADLETGHYYWKVVDIAGSESPVSQFHIGSPTSIDESEMPVQLALEPNYPNPFSTSTTIPFSLRESAYVKLEVFDVLGRRVLILVDEIISLGRHTAALPASNLSPGIYLYRLTTRNHTESKVLTVIK